MDPDSSSKFIGSLTKFLQSLCNGYVEFEDGVELIGHIYLSVDTGKKGKKIDYILNEKVCKSDNSVTFISNSFHALPDKAKRDDSEVSDIGDGTPRSTNTGTLPSRSQQSRSAPSPNQRSGVHTGSKRPGSPLKGPQPSQRRAHSPPSQRRLISSAGRPPSGSPASKTVPSSPSSSSQDNIPSPSPGKKGRSEAATSEPPSNQSDNADIEDIPSNVLSINPTPDFASFLGSLTSDNQSTHKSPRDTKPDTDVTFIKEEFVSEPPSCAQAGSSGHSGRSGEENGGGLYPVMLHQNTSVFPSTSAGYPPGFSSNASSTATSQSAFPGSSTSQSDMFNPVPGTSQDGADPSVHDLEHFSSEMEDDDVGAENDASSSVASTFCNECNRLIPNHEEFSHHMLQIHNTSTKLLSYGRHLIFCHMCGCAFDTVYSLRKHLTTHETRTVKQTCNSGTPKYCKKSGTYYKSQIQHKKKCHGTKQLLDAVLSGVSDAPDVKVEVEESKTIVGLSSTEVSCSDSTVQFASHVDYNQQELKIHENLTPYKCLKCNKSFMARSSLSRHKISCDNVRVVVCHICGKGFHRIDYLKEHLKGQHKRNKITSYSCTRCGEAFQFKSWMLAHKEKCKTSFQHLTQKSKIENSEELANRDSLDVSERLTNTFCTICEVQLSNRTDYGQHMLSAHSVTKPYQCSKCGKSFVQMSSLSRHKAGCEDNKLVFCHVCGRGFHRKDYLNDHLKGKHTRKAVSVYFCRKCGKGFQYKSWLFAHKKKCENVQSTSPISAEEALPMNQ